MIIKQILHLNIIASVLFVANGGSDWSGNWNNGTFALSTNLTFGTLQTSGQSMAGTGNYGSATRVFSGLNSGTVWFSYIKKFTGAATDLNARLNFGKDGSSKFVIGQKTSETNTTFHIYDASTVSVADTGISVEGSHFVAGSVNLDTGAITLYIHPTGLGSGSAPSSAASATATLGAFQLNEISTGSDSARFRLDEIRFGNSWVDVSPTGGVAPPPGDHHHPEQQHESDPRLARPRLDLAVTDPKSRHQLGGPPGNRSGQFHQPADQPGHASDLLPVEVLTLGVGVDG